MTTTPAYISTVIPAGYARYAVQLGGALLCVIDIPAHRGHDAAGLAHQWLLGNPVPEGVTVYPVAGALAPDKFDAQPVGG